MKWTKKELISLQEIEFDEDIEFDKEALKNNQLLLDVQDLHLEGDGYFNDYEDKFEVDLHITGTMICPCAISNEPVNVDLDSLYHETFVFHEEDNLDVHVVKNDIVELLPIVFQLISLDVPLRVVSDKLKDYPSGDGWRVLSESEYQKAKHDQVDPRLAKLKEFKAED
ncbi:MAG: YceD family protein [Erysipelotrichaceae bacterium]|nr:YceD family protein [Erysipelotrichaceae bacterium]MDY5252476.1 YceD family protein [Erysipelotrichaceae bacterium]